MYSYEDRIRAVELYIRLGKRVRATILQLGYPTKNALRAGTANTKNASICQWVLRFEAPNTARHRNRRL